VCPYYRPLRRPIVRLTVCLGRLRATPRQIKSVRCPFGDRPSPLRVRSGHPGKCGPLVTQSGPAGRRLNVCFLEELTAGRGGLSLSPTACRNERKGPSNRRGAEYACPDRRRPFRDTLGGTACLSRGKQTQEAVIRSARRCLHGNARSKRWRLSILLFSRNAATKCLSGFSGGKSVPFRSTARRSSRAARPFCIVVPFVGLGMRAWTPEIGTQDHIMHQPNRSGSKLSIAQRPVHHTRRSDSSSGA
jgi:hypothetical protein